MVSPTRLPQPKTTQTSGYSDNALSLFVFLAASFWGIYWVPLRMMEARGLEGIWSVVLFNACPFIALLPLIALHGPSRRAFRSHGNGYIIVGLLSGVAMAFYASGLVLTTVVRTTMLFYLMPVWGTLLGYFFLGERLGPIRVIAILLGLFGMFLLLANLSGRPSSGFNLGDGLAAISGVAWAMAAAYLKDHPSMPIVPTVTWQLLMTVIISFLLAAFIDPTPMPELAIVIRSLPVATIAAVFVLLPSMLVVFWVSKHLYPGRAGILMMSEVMVAVITAAIFLPEEKMAMLQWIGAGCIIAACLFEVLSAPTEPTDTTDV